MGVLSFPQASAETSGWESSQARDILIINNSASEPLPAPSRGERGPGNGCNGGKTGGWHWRVLKGQCTPPGVLACVKLGSARELGLFRQQLPVCRIGGILGKGPWGFQGGSPHSLHAALCRCPATGSVGLTVSTGWETDCYLHTNHISINLGLVGPVEGPPGKQMVLHLDLKGRPFGREKLGRDGAFLSVSASPVARLGLDVHSSWGSSGALQATDKERGEQGDKFHQGRRRKPNVSF